MSEGEIMTVTEFLDSCRRGPRGEKYVIIGQKMGEMAEKIWPIMDDYARRYSGHSIDRTHLSITLFNHVTVRCFSSSKLFLLKGIRLREALLLDCIGETKRIEEMLAARIWAPEPAQPSPRFGL